MRGWIAGEQANASTRFSRRRPRRVLRPVASATRNGSATRSYPRTSPCCSRRSQLPDLSVAVAGMELKNPVIAGSGEATATANGILAALDRESQAQASYVVPSLIVADADEAARRARELEQAGLRWLELNVAAPHAAEGAAGAIRVGTDLVAPIRAAVGMPLTVKVGGGDPVTGAVEAFDAGADIVCLTTRAQGFLPDLRTRRPLLGTFGAIGGAWTLPITLRHVAKGRAQLGAAAPFIAPNGPRDGVDG